MAMVPPVAVNIGIDSMATIKKGMAIIDHQRRRLQSKLLNKDGALRLGGTLSPLHR